MNQVSVSGRLPEDLIIKKTGSGKSVVSFDLAVYRSQDHTDWIPIVCWEGTADRLNNAQKGDMLVVTGSLSTRTYENKEGKTVKVVEINAFRVENMSEILTRKNEPKPSYQAPEPSYEEETEPVLTIDSDDLPF